MPAAPAPRSLAARLRAFLEGPRAVLWAPLIAVLVMLPALGQGLQVDDHWHRDYLVATPRWAPIVKSPFELFSFYDGDPARTHWLVDQGISPWWTAPTLLAAFFRPVSSLLHVLDHRLWPDAPAMMHAHSIAWYAALVLVVGLLYRRVLGPGLATGMAAICFAVDYTHGVPAAWIANRNALVAGAFGMLALWLHLRARRDGVVWAKLLGPFVLLVALFSGETAVAALGYFVAYALFLEDAASSLRARLATLLPYAPVVLLWAVVYRLGHYGVRGSGMYLDPWHAPLGYVVALTQHFPLLLANELGTPFSDFYVFMPTAAKALMLVVAVGVVALALFAFAPLVRRSKEARFFLAGAVLSILPGCATTPTGRLLLLSSFGWLGLIAMLAAALLERAPWLPPPSVRGAGARRAFGAYLAVGHLFISPFTLQLGARQMVMLDDILCRFAETVPEDPGLDHARLVIVNAPDTAFTGYVSLIRFARGQPTPAQLLTLAVGTRPVELERRDDRSLVVRSEGGFYRSGTDLLTHDLATPLPVGTRVELTGVTIDVTRAMPDGVPDEALVRFAEPLESSLLRWVTWQGRGFVPFTLPAVGQRVRIEGQTVSVF